MATIEIANTDQEIERCFPVMAQLRPHLVAAEFVQRIRRQNAQSGYVLVRLEELGEVAAVGGYRVSENLVYGKFLYVDDLVTAENARSRGHGGALLDWLVAEARKLNCDQFHLDSGVQRFGAHRFYLAKRMDITSHHFGLKLK